MVKWKESWGGGKVVDSQRQVKEEMRKRKFVKMESCGLWIAFVSFFFLLFLFATEPELLIFRWKSLFKTYVVYVFKKKKIILNFIYCDVRKR